MEFKDRLKELIELKNNGSQKNLSLATAIPTSTINCWLTKDIKPTYVQIIKLAQYFGVTTDYLLGLEDEFGIPLFTPEEKAAGISATKKISITPIEEDMLDVFRKVGKTRGESAQRAIIEMVEKML